MSRSPKNTHTHYLVAVDVNNVWDQTEFYTACSIARKRDLVFYMCSGNVTWEPWNMSTDPAHTTCPRCKATDRWKGASNDNL